MTTQHMRTAIATSTCLTFGVAVAVAVGAVPQVAGSAPASRVVSVAAPAQTVSHFLRHPAHLTPAHHPTHRARRTAHVVHLGAPASTVNTMATPPASGLVASITVQPVAASSTSAAAANIKHAVARHKKHHHKKKHHHHKKAPTTTKPALAPRTKPSASAISSAISGLRNYVHTPFTPTSAQVAQFGDEVCTAFDKNETYAQVKSVILQKVQQLPFTTVTAGAADYVIKTAVSLYCPGYKSKVS